jgi:hypothetical protein
MAEFDPREMSLRGRIGAYVTHSRHNTAITTAPGRAAFLARFEREVDPANELSAPERARRASYARKAHFARLARLSVNARRARAAARAGEAGVPSETGGAE